MSDHADKSKRRTRRWFVIGGVLVATALLLMLNVEREQLRLADLKWEIEQAGGKVTLPSPIWRQVWGRWRNSPALEETSVVLRGPRLDDGWLRAHDDLSALKIDLLTIEDSALDGGEIARLMARHPIEQLIARKSRSADEIATLLSNKPRVWFVDLGASDLTDAGLHRLPLEHIRVLDVSGTQVTQSALHDLKCCGELTSLAIDGSQFDLEVRDSILRLNQPSFSLTLCGPEVTDRHLELVREMAVGGNVVDVKLFKTSASQSAIKGLREQFQPPFRVTVRN